MGMDPSSGSIEMRGIEFGMKGVEEEGALLDMGDGGGVEWEGEGIENKKRKVSLLGR